MDISSVDPYLCRAWANVLKCNAYLSSIYYDFDKFVVPYITDDRCGLTVKPKTKVNCFPISYALAIITWAWKNKQSLRLKSVDNKVVFEFVKPKQ